MVQRAESLPDDFLLDIVVYVELEPPAPMVLKHAGPLPQSPWLPLPIPVNTLRLSHFSLTTWAPSRQSCFSCLLHGDMVRSGDGELDVARFDVGEICDARAHPTC